MSLIDDALKRAAEAGERRDAEKSPARARPWTPPPLPAHRRRTGTWLTATAAALAAGAVAWFLLARDREPRIVAPPEPARPAAARPVVTPAERPVEAPPTAVAVAPRRPPLAAAPEPRAAPAPPPVDPSAESPSRTRIVPPAAPAPVPPPAGKILLEGIVWSESDPVAMINGRIVRVGGIVEGYTVSKIEPEAVELQGEKGTIRLKLGSGS